jgi:hypothetical protein
VSLDCRPLEDGWSLVARKSWGCLGGAGFVADGPGVEFKSKADVKLPMVGPCALRRGAFGTWKPSGGAIIRRRLALGGR